MDATVGAHAINSQIAASFRRLVVTAAILVAVGCASVGPVVASADAHQKVRKSQQMLEQYKTDVNRSQTAAA